MRSTRYTLARQLANDTRGTHNAYQVMDRILARVDGLTVKPLTLTNSIG
jgi:hypothetical protein